MQEMRHVLETPQLVMAQKVNPIAVRLKFNRNSDSSWFSDYYYATFMYQDCNVVNYLSTIRQPTGDKLGFRPGRCVIHHYPKRSVIHLFCLGRRKSLKHAPKYSYDNLIPFDASSSTSDVISTDDREAPRSNDKKLWAEGKCFAQDSTLTPLELHVQQNSRRGRSFAHLVEQRLQTSAAVLMGTAVLGPTLSAGMTKVRSTELPHRKSSGVTLGEEHFGVPSYLSTKRTLVRSEQPVVALEELFHISGWTSTALKAVHAPYSWQVSAEVRSTVGTQNLRLKVGSSSSKARSVSKAAEHYMLEAPLCLMLQSLEKRSAKGTKWGPGATRCYARRHTFGFGQSESEASLNTKRVQSTECEHSLESTSEMKTTLTLQEESSTASQKAAHPSNVGSVCLKWFVMQYCFQLNTHCDVNETLQYIQPKGIKAKYLQLCLAKSRHYYLSNIQSILSSQSNTLTSIIPMKVTSVYQSASLVAQEICCKLEQTKSFRQICRTIFKEIKMCNYIKGIRIACSGRLNGAEIAKTECKQYGETSLHVFSDQIDYAYTKASTPYGILGVKVWICYL